MKRLIFSLPALFLIAASAQEPSYDFKKFRQHNPSKDFFRDSTEKAQPLDKIMGKLTFSGPDGTIDLSLDRSMSKDSLEKYFRPIQSLQSGQATASLLFTQPNGTRVFALPQDNMPCLVPDISQFNMPVIGKGKRITGIPPGSAPPNNIIPEK
jgi:hypothetical protein